jgi:peptidyl serine alpha-galactosyltransferase
LTIPGYSCHREFFDYFNDCKPLLKAFPDATSCTENIYGRDLPAYRPSTKSVLTNSRTDTWATSCQAKHPLTSRPCACVEPPRNLTFRTVFNVQASKYFEWQSRYMNFWHKQVGQPGKLTRLLSASRMDHLGEEVPTFVSPQYDFSKDWYVPYNKPLSITNFLRSGDVTEDVVVILDPDCCLMRPLDIPVEEGSPVAQQGYYTFKVEEPEQPEMQITRKYCPTCKHIDPIAVPVVIHRRDIERIAPLWLNKTEMIRQDKSVWPIEWNDNKYVVNRIEWVAEMFGYVFAAAELGIRHDIWHLQDVPGVNDEQTAPVLHYHVAVTIGGKTWGKGQEDAASNFVWPLPPGTPEVAAAMMRKLHDAHESLPPTGHVWTVGYNQPEF